MDHILPLAFEAVARWCEDFSLPCWRVDHATREIRHPECDVLAAMAHDEGLVSRILQMATLHESDSDLVSIEEPAPGARFILLREHDRRHRFGWVVTLAPTAESIQSGALSSLCAQHFDSDALAKALARATVVDEQQAHARAAALGRAHADAIARAESDRALDQFTAQLTQAYENACMALRVSRMMARVDDPAGFVRDIVQELHQTSEFGWVGFIRHADPHFRDTRVPDFCCACDESRFDQAQILAAAQTILHARGHDSKTAIVEAATITSEALGPELIIQPLRNDTRTIGLLMLGARAGKEWAVNSYDTLLVETTATSLAAFLETVRLYNHQHQSFLGTLGALTGALDAKDPYTCGHSQRVALLGRQLAAAVNLSPEVQRTIHIAGLVHDIGKIGVPETVLTGSGKPNDEEFRRIRQHPSIGHDILKGIPLLHDALPGVLHHHERWDGRGYPSGLKGNAIPRIARMLALCDAFDAMSSSRTYDAARARDVVLDEIRNCRGTHFDPELTDAFLSLDFAEYDAMLASSQSSEIPAEPQERRTRDRAA